MQVNHQFPGFFESVENPWTRQESQAFDCYLQQDLGLPSSLLLENAGNSLARAIVALLGDNKFKHVVFLLGPGHNGGDGLIAARQLQSKVEFSLWAPLGLPAYPKPFPGISAPHPPPFRAEKGTLIVDALFGIGLNRPVRGIAQEALQQAKASRCPVLAVDLPSGLDCDSGTILGECLPAQWTLSFVAPKAGFFQGAGPLHTGTVHVAEIGVSREFAERWRGQQKFTP